ncbi:MAG: beta-propeller domain-containing protein [Myxococcaceae bacterium]
MNRRLCWAVALALSVGCGGGTPPEDDPLSDDYLPFTQPGVKDRISLLSFSGANACGDLEQHLEDRATLQMEVALISARRSAYASWDSYHLGTQNQGSGGTMDAGSAAGGSGGGAGGGGGGPAAYTTTNTQVKGVDEPDFVKNDGTRIFVLSGGTLYAAVSWPATALSRQGSLTIEGTPREMFLDGSRLVVFSEIFDSSIENLPSWCSGSYYCGSYYRNATKITFVDVSDLSNLQVTQTHVVPGNYRTARRIGPVVRLVLSDRIDLPAGLRTWVDYQDILSAPSKRDLGMRFDRLSAQNEILIRGRTLSQWIPSIRSTRAGSSLSQPLDCASVAAPDVSGLLGLSSIVTLNLDTPSAVARTALLAQPNEVYASTGALYIAQTHWWWSSWPQPMPGTTYLYKFDLSQPDSVAWVGAGRVDGLPVDQFALDEHAGHLRVATTVDEPVVSSGQGWWATRTTNRITVLAEQGGALVTVGQSEDLAPGERIMSARFMGPRAYVVTFRQVDPLYTFDLSDPARPRKVGELKVPGFSSYLHPLDDSHLLAIGTFIPEAGGWPRTVQLSIFDVSDFTHPLQTFTQKIGESWGSSEAQWDHKAFNYFPERKLLAVPFFDWTSTGWGSYVSDLRVFRVDAQAGFTALGSLDMRDVLMRPESDPYGCWYWWWQPMVRRSVMADDFVYAISSGGIRVANVANLSQPVATITFGYDQP